MATVEGHPCGHREKVDGCGGCDPGAIEFVRDDGGPWVQYADNDARWGDHDERCCMGGFPPEVPPHPDCPGTRALFGPPHPDGLHPCQRRPHYGEPCECEARLAAVVTHHVVDDPAIGPPFCQECSEAISEYVPWDAAHVERIIPPGGADNA